MISGGANTSRPVSQVQAIGVKMQGGTFPDSRRPAQSRRAVFLFEGGTGEGFGGGGQK